LLMDTFLALAAVMAITVAACVYFRNNGAFIAPFVLLAGIIASLVTGMGFGIRQVIEGMFGYFDSIMAVLCGMVFMVLLYENGTLDYLFALIVGKKRSPFPRSCLMLLFVMLPGMLT